MPDFTFNGRLYHNPVELALDQIGGKWKMPILWRLQRQVLRNSELRRSMHCTDNMLATQLRELERDGYLTRRAYPTVPPKVEYTITARGLRTMPIIELLRAFGQELHAGPAQP